MKRLQAFAAIVACLVMPALAIVPDQDDWTVATMAPDGSWGSATEPSLGQALAKAIGNCKAMSGREIGCGAQSRAIQAGWVLADRCGDRNIIVAERRLADAEQAVRRRETDLRQTLRPGYAALPTRADCRSTRRSIGEQFSASYADGLIASISALQRFANF